MFVFVLLMLRCACVVNVLHETMLCSSYYKLPSVLASPSLANLFGLSQPAKLNSEADLRQKLVEKVLLISIASHSLQR